MCNDGEAHMEARKSTNALAIFVGLTIGGVILAIVGIAVGNPAVQSILVAFGAALFAGALAFFLIKAS
jgi:hypothetical protein